MEGFIRVASAVPRVSVADCAYNTERIENLMLQASGMGVDVVCFPELSLTGYTCGDLFGQRKLQDDAEHALLRLMELSMGINVVAIVGMPIVHEGMLLNCAAVVGNGHIYGFVPKTYLPNYKEFYEARWFSSASRLKETIILKFCGQNVPMGGNLLFETPKFTFGIEICEDLWATIPPSSSHALRGADVIFNLSSSNELVGKHEYLRSLVLSQSARCISGYVYSGSGYGESSGDLVYSGLTFIAENGRLLYEGERFQMKEQLAVSDIDVEMLRHERLLNTTFASSKDLMPAERENIRELTHIEIPSEGSDTAPRHLMRNVNPLPFVPLGDRDGESCEEILCIQSEGLARRIEHTKAETIVIGVSGGLDSTLALLVCVEAFDKLKRDRKGIIAITMPGFGTTDRTYTNAVRLIKSLGVTLREINISKACLQHFEDLGIDPEVHDATYENSQARERTQILMDAAGQTKGFVVGTGDMSELALGWTTYNGDHMSMYGVNGSVPKTLARHLVKRIAENYGQNNVREILLDIVDTPVSPELLPSDANGEISQKTEDLIGPYELHDFFLYYVLRYGFRPRKIFHLAQEAFNGSTPYVGKYTSEQILKWLKVFFKRFFSQQFKRSCLPEGPKVGSCSLSPRGDWRMPSDASAAAWLAECESLGNPATDN